VEKPNAEIQEEFFISEFRKKLDKNKNWQLDNTKIRDLVQPSMALS
jgi:hypothetical protein